jgi:hypothetical protein
MRYGTPVEKLSPGARLATHIVLAIWVVCVGFAQFANAEVRVSGKVNNLTIETQGAPLDEVLRALRTTYKFQYRDGGALPDVISGTYSGSLRRVVARLLEGHDFVMHGYLDDLSVEILGPKNAPGPSRAVNVNPAPAGPGPLKECQYKDGERVIAVEC